MHADFDLTQIALVALAALAGGVLLERFRQPAVLGYILAGVLLGPSLLALVENRESVAVLAEMGVLLLLFIIGMELELKSFRQTWHISLATIAIQISVTFGAIYLLSFVFNFSMGMTVLLAFSIALSSTAVAIKMLEGIGELKSESGRLTVGVLIAQDLAIVPMILIIRGMGADAFDITIVVKVLFSLAFLAAVIFMLGRKESLKIPYLEEIAKHNDMPSLVSLGFCFGLASLSGLVGLSAAYGAFIAGLILGNTQSHDALMKAIHPIQSTLMMVFFLSIGLLMDLHFIWDNIWKVLMLMLVITLGKSMLNIAALRILGQVRPIAFLSGLVLSQMGEFAFLLTTVASESGIVTANGEKLIISLAALSLAFSPLWLSGARRLIKMRPSESDTFDTLIESAFGREIKSITEVCGNGISACKRGIASLTKSSKDTPDA
ncbi:MAG: cation:proton antiporter [Alphaproteobacteria bacterium]